MPDSNHCESVTEFVRWALVQLDLSLNESSGAPKLTLPEADRSSFGGVAELSLSWDDDRHDSELEPTNLDSRFGQWLLRCLGGGVTAVHTRPSGQPVAVNDIAQRLFAAYQVDGGRVHLGGCQLTDFPFLRLSFAAGEQGPTEVRHIFVAHDGSSVDDQLVSDLGLLDIEPLLQLPPRIDDPALQGLIAAGRRVAAQSTTSRDPNATTVEPLAIALVWVKHASGQLDFTIDDATVSLPFSGWSRLIAAKPYTSPQSGASGFHLAATDDGRIDVFDQIVPCQHSGRRVLQQELVTCSATGKQVLEEFTETCPVSGKPCLNDQFVNCPSCLQQVSKSSLQQTNCDACQKLAKIKKDDPRIVWILGEHPGLDRWNRWQLAETKTVYIALASRWTKRLLLVVDKESLAVHHLATAGKLTNTWTPVPEPVRDEILR